jgi:hypothetical protein
MVSWVSLVGLLLVAIVLLCSGPGGAVAGKRNQLANSRGGGVGHWGKRNKGNNQKERKDKSKARQKESRFNHCDYIDLVEVGHRDNSNCAPGGKFLFKVFIPLFSSCPCELPFLQAAPGIRRQFLMTNETNIALFLERGKKFSSCNDNFNDITASVKCKVRTSNTIPCQAMDGVMNMGITKKTGGASCAKCPGKQQIPAAPATVMTDNTKTNKQEEKTKPKAHQKEGRFNHCDYIDLVEVGHRDNSNCAPGGKFLFKVFILITSPHCEQPFLQAAPGIRRQFLMTKETNIAIFLGHGKKFDSCNDNFNDITASVKCKVRCPPRCLPLARLWTGSCK